MIKCRVMLMYGYVCKRLSPFEPVTARGSMHALRFDGARWNTADQGGLASGGGNDERFPLAFTLPPRRAGSIQLQ